MRHSFAIGMSGLLLAMLEVIGGEPVLRHSDVVFMYQANPETYARYGATVLAWGGTPTPESKADAAAAGVRFFASVGMVTEFSRYYERFPETYQDGLCRDLNDQPVKVPWLVDHQHRGIPFWWCCTKQPQFREYLRERVVESVTRGADGVHVDDHLGTAASLWLGTCFCDRCVEGFREHVRQLPLETRARLGITQPSSYDYREVLRAWRLSSSVDSSSVSSSRELSQHPVWSEWTIFHGRAASQFMHELRELAAATAGHPMPIGANAGLLWPRHLADYQAIDLFSAETDHQASRHAFSDLPIVAYRMAEAVQRPYAATASGEDWALIKAESRPGLVRGWIALAHASGQWFMAPHRQWCHTNELGTHWYDGPAEKYSLLFQFVREQAAHLDGYQTHADVSVLMPHASYLRNPQHWFDLFTQLSANNLSYRLILAGDELVDAPLTVQQFAAPGPYLITERDSLMPVDRRVLETSLAARPVFTSVEELMRESKTAVRLTSEVPVRILPRVREGSAVIHLVNWDYLAKQDDVQTQHNIELQVDLQALGVSNAESCQLLAPDQESVRLRLEQGKVVVPQLGLWCLLVIDAGK